MNASVSFGALKAFLSHNPVMDTFAKRLSYARELRDLTQDGLADLVGVRRQAVTNWERGKGVTTTNIKKLAAKLDCNFGWLATGDGPPPAQSVAAPLNGGLNSGKRVEGQDIIGIYNDIRDDLKQAAREALRAIRDYQPK